MNDDTAGTPYSAGPDDLDGALIIDVRRAAAFGQSSHTLPGACWHDPALAQLALIVRGADTSRLDLTPQSAGLYAVSLGLSRVFADDHEMLRHGLVMYDALYAWCREGRAETHQWPPVMAGSCSSGMCR